MVAEAIPSLPKEERYDYGGMCWWCGGKSNSREHKYKKTDVVRAFGPPPWTEAVVHVRDGKSTIVQGPNSALLKFQDSLCAHCNTARSQPFDKAYTNLMSVVATRRSQIIAGKQIDQADVHGANWEAQQANAMRFVVKLISCRLAESGVMVPASLIRFLDGVDSHPAGLNLQLCLNLNIADLEEHLDNTHGIPPAGSLWLGACIAEVEPPSRRVCDIRSYFGIECFWYLYHISNESTSFRSNLNCKSLQIPLLRGTRTGPIAAICESCNQRNAER